MSPLVKFTLGRLGLFAAAFLLLWPVPGLSLLVKLLVALLVSFTLSWFVLRRWRDQLATDLAGKVERRRRERERLRSALSGDDEWGAGSDPGGAGSGAEPGAGGGSGAGSGSGAGTRGSGVASPGRDEPA